MQVPAPSIVLVVRDNASDCALPVAAPWSLEPLSRGWNYVARPAGGPQGQNRKVISLSVLCGSTAEAPPEPELGIIYIERERVCLDRSWGRVAKLR